MGVGRGEDLTRPEATDTSAAAKPRRRGTSRAARVVASGWRGIHRRWFALLPSEQQAILLVLAIFLLGLAVRLWRAR